MTKQEFLEMQKENPDMDEDWELNVEWYPIPEGLLEAAGEFEKEGEKGRKWAPTPRR